MAGKRHRYPLPMDGALLLLWSAVFSLADNPLNPGITVSDEILLKGPVRVQIFEQLNPSDPLDLRDAVKTSVYHEPAFGFPCLPQKYSSNALPLDRSIPFAIRATMRGEITPGMHWFRLRSKGLARFSVNGTALLKTVPQRRNTASNDDLPPPPERDPRFPSLRPPPAPHQEVRAEAGVDEGKTSFELIAIVGGKGLAPFPGELSVSEGLRGQLPRLLGGPDAPELSDALWEAYRRSREEDHRAAGIARRRGLSKPVARAWDRYHQAVRTWVEETQPSVPVPEVSPSTPVFNAIDRFVGARLEAANIQPNGLTSDLAFFRRLSLDTVGLIPTPGEIRRFLADPPARRRQQAIERFLARPGWADHWVGYWQDVLAENPGILKPDLNNTGPFRWWLHQCFYDNLPFDRWVAELIQMKGSAFAGAPAGFGIAKLNDAPMAAKANILSQAFLGETLSCARCHDAPDRVHKQIDTFGFAAMLKGRPVELPETSTVPSVEGFRRPRVKVSLKPGETIYPHWPFTRHAKPSPIDRLIPLDDGVPPTRNEVARRIVSPANKRFAKVVVNRVWKRLMGAGMVEPAEDWEGNEPSHPGLLAYLAREFVVSGYDLKGLTRLMLGSHTYQRKPVDVSLIDQYPKDRLFAGPARRRLTAEELVDSLHRCAGKGFGSEELNLNPLGDRPLSQFLNLGRPKRAWEFTALMNERDRPSLALPAAQSVVDVLGTFGWRQSRMNPLTERLDAPSAMQTLILANGVMGNRVVRLSEDSEFTRMAMKDVSFGELIEETFLRILSRPPAKGEAAAAAAFLGSSFPSRRVKTAKILHPRVFHGDHRVSWANHFDAESSRIRMAEERTLRIGDPPTQRLTKTFRERYEDLLWSLINAPEFILIP